MRATFLRIHFPLKHYQYILILRIVAGEQSKIKKEFLNVIIVDKCYQAVMNYIPIKAFVEAARGNVTAKLVESCGNENHI